MSELADLTDLALTGLALTGLPLTAARKLLAARGVAANAIIIKETQPPRSEHLGGAWRVLRSNVRSEKASDALLFELVVAREQISEAHSRPRAETVDNSH